MTYLAIRDQGLPKTTLGERCLDCINEEKIQDALRACSLAAAAQAMDFQGVDMMMDMRVLTGPSR